MIKRLLGVIALVAIMGFFSPIFAQESESEEDVPQAQSQTENESVSSVAANNEATIFAQLLQQTGFEQTLDTGGPYTVFVPTDAAMQQVPPEVVRNVVSSREAVVDMLENHMVKGVIKPDNMDETFQTLNGMAVTITRTDEGTFVNGQKIVGASRFDDGVVYMIEGTMMPQSAMQ